MDWQAVSEINFGRLIRGEVSPTLYQPTLFYPPYDRGCGLLVAGKSKGEIIQEIGLEFYQSALHALDNLNGASKGVDWNTMLEKSAVHYFAAEEFDSLSKKLRKNQEISWDKIDLLRNKIQTSQAGKFVTLHDIWDAEPEPFWKKSGVMFLDYWLGGIPRYGLFTIGARPKAGKTSFAMGLAIGHAKTHDQNIIIFTLEMMALEFKERLRELEASGELTEEQRKRIYLCAEVVSPEESISWASAIPNIGLIIVDFADLMVQGEVTEPKMTALYRTLALGAKTLKTPIALISQLSGNYSGGIPRPHHIRYTRLAEALVVLQIMLYVPWSEWHEENEKDAKILPPMTGAGYVIKWMSRYKTRKNVGVPHAILVDFDSANGWKINEKGESFKLSD
jgi:hypothetical protein